MVPESALVVWQLRGLVEDVHCFFFPRRAGWALAVERAGERLLDESYHHFPALMARAREMRQRLVDAGFEPVEEAVNSRSLEWQLRQFVRAGAAPARALLAMRAC